MTCTIEKPCEDCVELDTFLEAHDAFVDFFKGVSDPLDEVLDSLTATVNDIQNIIDKHITNKEA